jgi:hypothetical protein
MLRIAEHLLSFIVKNVADRFIPCTATTLAIERFRTLEKEFPRLSAAVYSRVIKMPAVLSDPSRQDRCDQIPKRSS